MVLKTLLITQARIGSTRLPGKVLMEIKGKTLLQIHLQRIKESKLVTDFLVATTDRIEDQVIYNKAIELGFKSYCGSVDDVLDRFYKASIIFKPDWVVRVTSDCPLLDAKLIDAVIEYAYLNDVDYCSNTLVENFPDGQDIEVFKFNALEKAWKEAKKKSEREHVTLYIKENSDFMGGNLFTAMNYACEYNFSSVRMTVDEDTDFKLIVSLIEDLGIDKSWLKYTNHIIGNNLQKINEGIVRNEGLLKSLKND